MRFFDRLKNTANKIAGGFRDVGTVAESKLDDFAEKNLGAHGSGPDGSYRSYDEVPWWERAVLGAGSGVEGLAKKAFGFVGLDDIAPSGFTDAEQKIKTDISQKGYSEGFDWGAFRKGSANSKIYDQVFNDQPQLDESAGSSLDVGSGISGGGQNSAVGLGDNLPSRLGSPSGGSSLGRALAIQEDPALKDENYNRNNFNF